MHGSNIYKIKHIISWTESQLGKLKVFFKNLNNRQIESQIRKNVHSNRKSNNSNDFKVIFLEFPPVKDWILYKMDKETLRK